MEQEKNEKILAMYRAVWELTREGQNVYNIKVVDITNRAGIGKGTAYEYFRSKEELVAKALRYGSYLEYERLLKQLKEQTTLKDAMDVCFHWLEEDYDRMSCLLQFLKNTEKQEELIRNGMKCMQENMARDAEKIHELLRHIVGIGKKEGSIRADIPDEMASLQILSQLMGYFVFERFNREKEVGSESVRNFLYMSMENGLK